MSVGLSVCRSGDFVKKLPLEYQIVTKTYQKLTFLPTYATVLTVRTVVTVVTVVTKKLFFLPNILFHQKVFNY